jgi:glyoxylase-like metal-dependent hydrolase (beta-lactamase superfamily II)
VIGRTDIRRILLGHFTIPDDGDLRAGEKVVVCGYLLRHPDGIVLFDTGIAEGHAETEKLYRPVRRDLDGALASAGVTADDVRAVVNCHFHLDHCGGNPRFAGRPIFAQRTEFDAAHAEEDYPIVELYDFPDARYELHDGEADVFAGLRVVPTPGHTAGHQSLVVDTDAGRVVLAGQAVNGATDYGRAWFASELRRHGSNEDVTVPEWVQRLEEFDPVEVLFAHDTATWARG